MKWRFNMMHVIDKKLLAICQLIKSRGLSEKEWGEIESTDAFQENDYVGGFDDTEKAFCFSYYDLSGKEFWFQLTLNDVDEIVALNKKEIKMREAE